VNDRQEIALNNVATGLSDAAALEKYARTLTRGTRKFGTILTLDLHKKDVSWHVCVSMLDSEGKPLLTDHLSSADKSATLRLARELLFEIGRPSSDSVREDEKSVHILRAMTIEEERQARKAIARKAAPRDRD
jgi:hypothetical protein